MTPRRPVLAVRDALASAIVCALDDRGAMDALTALLDLFRWGRASLPLPHSAALAAAGLVVPPADAPGDDRVALRAIADPYRAAAVARLTRAQDAVRRFWEVGAAGGSHFDLAFAQAVTLWDAALFFEVHEVLERLWRELRGETRRSVQGVIQVAAALHHVETGNRDGARTLMSAGRVKLAPAVPACEAFDVALLVQGIDTWQAAEAGGAPLESLLPPRLRVAPRSA